MLRSDDVYDYVADPYERLISKEDYERRLDRAILEIVDWNGRDLLDVGAGTGRFSCMAAPTARSITAVDFAADMLRVTADKLRVRGLDNWKTHVADMRELPVPDRSADIAIAGWSICYLGSTSNTEWQENVDRVVGEMVRAVRDGGTIMIFETLGTGLEEPERPEFLAPYYERLEQVHGFRHAVLRTDYRFDSVEQAETLCRDFFGKELGDRIRASGSAIVPECTGMWWKTVRNGNDENL